MSRVPAVPYCTVKGFRGCLEILQTAPPTHVDRQSLVDRGVPPHAVYPVLGGLRFLGLVDDAGQLTPDLAPFLDGADVIGRRRVFERAYAAVLADVRFPVDEREEVDRMLMARHDVAPGVAAFCSTFFLWLAAESGIPVCASRRVRRGRPPAHLAQLSDVARALLVAQALPDATSEELEPFVSPDEAEAPRPVEPARPAARPQVNS